MNETSLAAPVQILGADTLTSITRAEVDCQIATAHQFPRSMAQFRKRALEMATLDEETAASCLYSRPVGGGKFAEGMSVRMAEIVAASYGNIRVASMIVEQTERQIKARGVAHDLESNFASTSEVIEATVKKDGTPYDERMRVVIAKACLAKARRDATFQVIPKALCKTVEEAARKTAVGDAVTLEKRRASVMDWVKKLGIDPIRVFSALSVKGEADIGIDQLATLTGLKTAIKDGDVTVDEAFPVVAQAPKEKKGAKLFKPADPVPVQAEPETPAQVEEKPAAPEQAKEAAAIVEPATKATKPEPKPEPEPKAEVGGIPVIKAALHEAKLPEGKAVSFLQSLGYLEDGQTLDNLDAEGVKAVTMNLPGFCKQVAKFKL